MALLSTTKMMNLLTLVLVTLPGLTLSFSNTQAVNPWIELYKRVQAATYPYGHQQPGGYICCNQPATSPSPRRPPIRSLILSLAKRDDRDALLREALMASSSSSRGLGDAGLFNIPGWRGRGGLSGSDSADRDPLLLAALQLLAASSSSSSSSGRQGVPQFRSRQALSRSSAGGPGRIDFDGSTFLAKRTQDDDAYMYPGKRGEIGDLGGPNMIWEWPPPTKRPSKRFAKHK